MLGQSPKTHFFLAGKIQKLKEAKGKMNRLKKIRFNQPKRTKFIVKESYTGTKKSEEIFAKIFISENATNSKKMWTLEQNIDIIEVNPQQVDTDNSQIHVCSNANSVRKE